MRTGRIFVDISKFRRILGGAPDEANIMMILSLSQIITSLGIHLLENNYIVWDYGQFQWPKADIGLNINLDRHFNFVSRLSWCSLRRMLVYSSQGAHVCLLNMLNDMIKEMSLPWKTFYEESFLYQGSPSNCEHCYTVP